MYKVVKKLFKNIARMDTEFHFSTKNYVIVVSDFLKKGRAEMFLSLILIYDIAYLLWRE